ncbi:XrtA system polysaccharide deacetylase [Pelagibius marinus]|uniref:XrtA system polysaccharide deacetylase n=1 Tax=Pelagibius marinus TaxID=2762760 RepID=UPI001872FF24|nr:XrtA system polysaccharide deacetylase [Pelagibius marinus]
MSVNSTSAHTGAMTVDVEDYFQVAALAEKVRRADWDSYPCRVERNVDRILAMFAERRVRATFFTLGWIAERYPLLIRRIVGAGHELASHGYEHVKIHNQAPDAFRLDIRRTKAILEQISGQRVRGYRAASFSIDQRTLWAFDVLAEEGYDYSSSVYPIRHDHYGMPDASRFAFHPSDRHRIIEIPISTLRLFDRNLPSGGGGYFRLLPYGVSRWALRRIGEQDGQPTVFFFHPWEIDPEQPRIAGLSLRSRFRHYVHLGAMEERLRAVLRDFSWDRIDRLFLSKELGEECPATSPTASRSIA